MGSIVEVGKSGADVVERKAGPGLCDARTSECTGGIDSFKIKIIVMKVSTVLDDVKFIYYVTEEGGGRPNVFVNAKFPNENEVVE